MIAGGKTARVWRMMEEYSACLSNWHKKYGNRELIFVGPVNNEFIAEIPLRNFELNFCRLSSDSLLSQIT